MRSLRLLTTISLSALALAGAGPARAQETAPQNQQSPTLPQTIPGLEDFSLPSSSNDRLRLQPTPTPRASPTPASTPTPRATPIIRPAAPPPVMVQPLPTPSATPSRRAPEPRATATPTPEPTPSPTPTASPVAEPLVPPVAAPSPTPTPAAGPTPVATPAPKGEGGSLLPIVLALLGIAAAGLAWLFLSRRRAAAAEEQEPAVEEPPVPVVPPRRIAPAERPQLELAFRPRRAGMNVLSAAVDYELTVRNTGNAPARDIRVALRLFTAGERHDAEVKQFLEEPVDSPIVAPFDLAPGETKPVRAMAMLPKAAVNVVTVKGRPMFVPMVAINALYQWGDGRSGQTATSHVVGIAKPGMPKMQPFWLDAPPRMYDGVGEHAHAIALRR
jgi:hypothetical protein